MRTVWKYQVPVDDQNHEIGFWPVHVAAKDERTLFVWCEVEPDEDGYVETEPFRVFGTGQPIPLGAAHAGTVQVGPFVWHLYNMTLATS